MSQAHVDLLRKARQIIVDNGAEGGFFCNAIARAALGPDAMIADVRRQGHDIASELLDYISVTLGVSWAYCVDGRAATKEQRLHWIDTVILPHWEGTLPVIAPPSLCTRIYNWFQNLKRKMGGPT
jgi:hypothetical protein